MECKGVIFDFNGTLFFDNDKHVKAWNEISKIIRNKEISNEELHTYFNGVPNKEIIQYMFNNKADINDIEKYSLLKEKYYRYYCKEDISTFHLVKGTTSYFDKLKANKIPFTIASASIKENIDFFNRSFLLEKWINPNIIVYDDGTYKDKIAMFSKAASLINVPISDCIIYEDSISGIKNAYKAGCRNIIVIDSANKKDEYSKLPGVIKVINDFTDE